MIVCSHDRLCTGKELVVTVWGHDFAQFGRRLGIVYCMNRPCSLYRLPAPGDGEQVTHVNPAAQAM